MSAIFEEAYAVLMKVEGGRIGCVEQSTYDSWRHGQNLPTRPVRFMTDAEARELVLNFYWTAYGLAGLPPAWAMFCLVEGANLPFGDAIKLMQAALLWNGAYTGLVDGQNGPETLAAAAKLPGAWKTANLMAAGHYATQSDENIQHGLQNRLRTLQTAIEQIEVPKPPPSGPQGMKDG